MHHALGHSGGARGVNDGHQVVGVQRRQGRVGVAECADFVPTLVAIQPVVGRRYHRDSVRNTVPVARDVVELAQHHHLGLGVLEHRPRGGRINGWINGHRNRSGQRYPVVVNQPVGRILADQRYPIARLHAQRIQSAGKARRLGVGLGVGELNASALDGLVQKQAVRKRLGVPRQLLGHQSARAVRRQVLQALFGHKPFERTQNFEHPRVGGLLGVERGNGRTDAHDLAACVDAQHHNRNPRRLGNFVVAAPQPVNLGPRALGRQREAKIRVVLKMLNDLADHAACRVLVNRNSAQLAQKPALNAAKQRFFAQNMQVVQPQILANAESGPKILAVGVRTKNQHVLLEVRGEWIPVLPTASGQATAQKAQFHASQDN